MVEKVKSIVLVASGKGGVGKSTVATNLAIALVKIGKTVGLLDADIQGPSVPLMMGPVERPGPGKERLMVPPQKFGMKLMSMGYFVSADTALIYRGPVLAGAATQLVQDVEWGELDYLVVDLPPGTGDIQLTFAQRFKIAGALLVTTPQLVAVADVVRAKSMFDKVQVKTLGLVENMSYFLCPDNDKRYEIFGHGGGERAARELGVDFLGRVPIEAAVSDCGDAGEPVVSARPESESAKAFVAIAAELDKRVVEGELQRAKSAVHVTQPPIAAT